MSARRLVLCLLHGMCRLLWGFAPPIVELIVEDRGTVRALRWFCATMPRFLVSLRVLGPVRVHLACVVVSLRNGCLYCAYSHVYALELIHLRDTGRLFPIDARRLTGWVGLDDRSLRRRLHAVLVHAGLHLEAMWTDRVIGIADGSQQPVDSAEVRLAHLARMVTAMNTVAIAAGAEPVGAHDAVNKDRRVKLAHAALRGA